MGELFSFLINYKNKFTHAMRGTRMFYAGTRCANSGTFNKLTLTLHHCGASRDCYYTTLHQKWCRFQDTLNFFTRNDSEFQTFYKKTGGAWCHRCGADVVQAFQNHDFIQKCLQLVNRMNNQYVLICNHHCEVCA